MTWLRAFVGASRLGILVLSVLCSWVLAQSPAELARQAVQDWQAGKYTRKPGTATSSEDLLRTLERQLAFAPVPSGLSVNLNQPEVDQGQGVTTVRFPAVVGGRGGDVQVSIRGNEVTRIGFRPEGGLLPAWIKSPVAWGAFVGFSLAWFWLLFGRRVPASTEAPVSGGNILRAWWAEGWAVVRRYWRMYLGLNIGLYGLFILGSVVAYANPQAVKLMQESVGGALEEIGIGSAVGNGVLGLMLVIFYWNFVNGLLLITALPGLLMGIPALLINAARYFVLGFALSPQGMPLGAYIAHIPTIVIELQGYILATFGGLVLMMEVLRGGGLNKGLRAWGLMVYLGAFFLLVGAWYEAFEVVYLLR